jgi:hypothetical protein
VANRPPKIIPVYARRGCRSLLARDFLAFRYVARNFGISFGIVSCLRLVQAIIKFDLIIRQSIL